MMEVKKTTPKFKCDDGTEFDTAEEAKRHGDFVDARNAYTGARRNYAVWLWHTQKTADGCDFSIQSIGRYYYLDQFIGDPTLRDVSFYLWRCDLDDNDNATIRVDDGKGGHSNYRIDSLYKNVSAAREALAVAIEKRIAALQKELDALPKPKENPDV